MGDTKRGREAKGADKRMQVEQQLIEEAIERYQGEDVEFPPADLEDVDA
ncbi:MAG: hypothetical protein ABEJ28_07740 [Salinigranum sp.]